MNNTNSTKHLNIGIIDLIQCIRYTAGLAICGLVIYYLTKIDLGLAPWEVLSKGISLHVPLTFGQVIIVISAVVLILDIIMKEKIGDPIGKMAVLAEGDAALKDGARECGTQIQFRLAKGGPEGYTVLRGEWNGHAPDDDSPVYIDTVLGLYEALPGVEGFSLCLPEEAAAGPVRVLFCEGGALLSLTGSPAA